MAEEQRDVLPKPTVWDQLYPGRFIKAGELLGKKVTLTITDIDLEKLIGDDGKKKVKGLLSFKETDKQLALCKTNGICIKSMFGPQLANWKNKRITIFEDTWNGEPATRIWGSPDIQQDMEVEISLPRRRAFKKMMHKMGGRPTNGATNGNGNGNGNAGEIKPPPPEADSIKSLRSAQSREEFEQIRTSVWGVYAAAKANVPLEIEAAANEIRESFDDSSDLPTNF